MFKRTKKCEYSTVLLNIQDEYKEQPYGHLNVFFTHYIREKNSMEIVVYEPHGTIPPTGRKQESIHYTKIDLFLQGIKDILKMKGIYVKILPRYTVSCPIGLQSKTKDTTGFCVVYSLFMVYCVLWMIRAGKYKQGLRELLSNIEEDVIKIFDKKLDRLLTIFIISVSNIVLEYIPKSMMKNFTKVLAEYTITTREKIKMVH